MNNIDKNIINPYVEYSELENTEHSQAKKHQTHIIEIAKDITSYASTTQDYIQSLDDNYNNIDNNIDYLHAALIVELEELNTQEEYLYIEANQIVVSDRDLPITENSKKDQFFNTEYEYLINIQNELFNKFSDNSLENIITNYTTDDKNEPNNYLIACENNNNIDDDIDDIDDIDMYMEEF